MEEGIQFVAKMGDWVSVKKLTVTGETVPLSVMEFLASLNSGLDRKVEENLGKIIEVGAIDAFIDEQVAGAGKSEAAVAAALAAVKGPKLGKLIKEELEKLDWQKNQKKELEGFVRAYAARKALKEVGVAVDYSQINIPGMKKLMRKKG